MSATSAEAIKKEPETPLKISYSLFPRLLESKDNGDYEIPKMTPLKSVVAEQGIHDGFIPAKEKQENFANLATTTVKAENDEIQKSHKDMGSVNVEDRHKIIILERGRVMLGCVVS